MEGGGGGGGKRGRHSPLVPDLSTFARPIWRPKYKLPPASGKTLDSNDQNQVADQRISLKQWFAGGAQSRGLRKPACGRLLVVVIII